MSGLLQISDPHFGTEQPQVLAALTALVAQLAPDVLVLSGDITQRARRGQFDAARRYVEQLQVANTLVIPGNHDIPMFNLYARLLHPYANHQRVFGKALEPVLDLPELLLIGVNTTRAWRHKDGEVSLPQIRRVAERLRSARTEQLRIVITHQPLHVPRPQDEHNLLHGHAHAAHAWADAGADLVMGGHIHLPYVLPLRERHPQLSRPLWCVQAGTAVSSRIRREAPNSVNLIRYDAASQPPQCVVERWDYHATLQRFDCVQHTEIPLERKQTLG